MTRIPIGRQALTAVLAVFALSSAACAATTPPRTSEPVWVRCPDQVDRVRQWECATVAVPLDHTDPGGARIELALIRTRTADPARRLGSLVYNPGGPGGSGFETIAAMANKFGALADRYDLVSWDPRGVGRSSPVRCADPDFPERVPRTEAEWAALDGLSRSFAESCAGSAQLLPHVGLFDSARDLETIRTVLGEQRLNFFGVSYGGQLGAAYATLFPDRVGRMVLDAPGSPLRTYQRSLLDQSRGIEAAFGQFAAACRAAGRCPLGDTDSAAVARLDSFLAGLETAPLPTARGDRLTRAVATGALVIGLSAPEIWPDLQRALASAYTGSGDELIGYGDLFTGRRPDGTRSSFAAVNTAVNCADFPDVYSVNEVRALLPVFAAAAPRFGELTALRLAECVYWPVRDVGRAPIGAAGTAPILLIGTIGDPQAPHSWVAELAGKFDTAVLLTYAGVGHGAYGGVDPCVDTTVNSYLTDAAVPAAASRCG